MNIRGHVIRFFLAVCVSFVIKNGIGVNMSRKCFLDLDGVLVDFIGGANKLLDREDPWLRVENLGKWGGEEMYGLTPREFWDPMGEDFWANLEWTKEGTDILDLVESTLVMKIYVFLQLRVGLRGLSQGKFVGLMIIYLNTARNS